MFQRTHLTTHLISEYTFTQTTGSSSSSAASADSNLPSVQDEATSDDHDNSVTAQANAAIQTDDLVIEQKISTVDPGAETIRERAAYGNSDVI